MSVEPRRSCYPTDTTEEEWSFAAPYLTLLLEDVGQRRYALHASSDALRWIVRARAAWRRLPRDFLPWHVVYDQARRSRATGCCEVMAHGDRLRGAPPSRARPFSTVAPCNPLPRAASRAG